MTIYAIWEANGYTVVYDPNIPSGETYYGTMENFNFTYDTPIKLSKNQYERPGYEFIGWSKEKEPDSSAKIYADEEVVINLTTKKGELLRECPIFECAELRSNGLIYARLSMEALSRWKETLGLMQLPRLYFTLDRKRFQAAPAMLYYIALMRHISNKSGRHKDTLRIESLLAVTTLPTVEEVRQTRNGGIKERIVDRFFRELHALDSELKFHFQRNSKPISEKAVRSLRFEDLLDVCICMEWVHENQFRSNGKTVTEDG